MAEKKNYDSEFCGSVPLNYINLIQDYGFLIVLEKEDLTIVQVSENCRDLVEKDIPEIINQPVKNFLAATDFTKLSDLVNKGIIGKIPVNLSVTANGKTKPLSGLLHIRPGYIILELEPAAGKGKHDFIDVFQEVKQVIAAIEQADTVKEVCEVALHELKRISGFDGVLMYRFDEDWNGTVLAENKDSRLESYIGQTFPASDIPKQARDLYLKNPYRLIPNREYKPIGLFPVINPLTNSFIDLSDCNLRSVPAVHLEYMKNMNINASMSIRVIKDNKLWGLISCHHLTARYLNYELCCIFEWLSSVISVRISAVIDKEEFEYSSNLQQVRSFLADQVYALGNINALLGSDRLNILSLFKADGAAIFLNNHLETLGAVPDRESLSNLQFWLQGKNVNRIYATNYLSGVYDDALPYAAIGSGIMVVPVDSDKGDYLICFRKEVIETINWGGDPNSAITFDKDGKNYHPRNSFKNWQQIVSNHSLPWRENELDVAESLRGFLFEFRTKQLFY